MLGDTKPGNLRGDGPQIPDHQLIRCVGEGSYGQVWLARSVLGTYRAVKIVFRAKFQDEAPYEREFRGIKKFEPVSRSHPGLVQLLHVGRNEAAGYFYYVMELADDARDLPEAEARGTGFDPEGYEPKTLTSELNRRGSLDAQSCVQLGLSLTSALSHLHGHSLTHRDLKPSNIIFVNNQAKIADIGLVADLGSSKSFVGTEGFIAPEGPGTVQADLYSLGKVLYEAVTGLDRRNYPILPDEWSGREAADRSLEVNEIVVKACAEDPAKRYKTAEAIHADFELLQAGKSVKRLRALEGRVALLTRVLVALGVMLFLSAGAYYLLARAERLANQRLAEAYMAYATRSVNESDLFGALPWYAEALALEQGNREREHRYRIHLGLMLRQCPKLVRSWVHPGEAQFVALSPDNLAIVSAGSDGTAIAWDIDQDRQRIRFEGHEKEVMAAVYNQNGSLLATASWDWTARIWDTSNGRLLQKLAHRSSVFRSEFHPRDDSLLLTAGGDGMVQLWDWRKGVVLREYTNVHRGTVRSACFSSDGTRLITGGEDGLAQLWDVESGEPIGPAMVHEDWVYDAVLSPDGRFAATACFDNKAVLWEAGTGRELWMWAHEAAVGAVAFSPDGRYLATGCWDLATRLWNIRTRKLAAPPLKHGSQVRDVAFDASGRRLVTATTHGLVSVWDLSPVHWKIPVTAIHSADGRRSATSSERAVQVWDATTTQLLTEPIPQTAEAHDLKLNHDGSRLLVLTPLSSSTDSSRLSVQAWDTSARRPRPVGPPFEVDHTAGFTWCMSQDGRYFAAFSGTTGIVWSTVDGRPLRSIASDKTIFSPAFHPTGSWLAFCAGPKAELWEPLGDGPPRVLAHESDVEHLEFSLDGTFLVTACVDDSLLERAAQIWEVRSWTKHGPPLGHRDGVYWASFSSDNRRVVTGSEDNTAQVWSVRDGKRLMAPLIHGFQVYFAGFSPDNRWIGTGSRDRTARVWDSELGLPITPPLRHGRSVAHVQFIAGNDFLITTELGRGKWLWDLRPDVRPVAALKLLAELLSRRTIDPIGGAFTLNQQELPLSKDELERRWAQLRDAYPAEFSVTVPQQINWHERELENSESESATSAALFHLERLLDLRPDEPRYSRHQERLLKELTGPSGADP